MVRTPKQWLMHLCSGPWLVRRYFDDDMMHRIEQAIELSEQQHSGQIRFVVESSLHPYALFRKKSPLQRALELFSSLGVWDTQHNNGVLIYLLLADRDVEIVADRGIHQSTSPAVWESICRQMETLFHQNAFESGVRLGIELVGKQLAQCFPADGHHENELPDQPVVL